MDDKYHLRRNEKEITNKNQILEILKKGKFATISMCRNNEPYLVTLSYGYDVQKKALYFHCAKEGLKIEFLKQNSNVCGTIIEDNGYTVGCGQAFRSVVFWGKIEIIKGLKEKKYGFDILLKHLDKDPKIMKEKFFKSDDVYIKPAILRLDIYNITGKEEKPDSN